VTIRVGDTPGVGLVHIYLTDLAAHTGDLEAATGQPERLDPGWGPGARRSTPMPPLGALRRLHGPPISLGACVMRVAMAGPGPERLVRSAWDGRRGIGPALKAVVGRPEALGPVLPERGRVAGGPLRLVVGGIDPVAWWAG
jgi:hypothetical protein